MTRVDLPLLAVELARAGVVLPGPLSASDNTLETVHTWDAGLNPVPLPPEADPVVAAHDASKPQRTAAFETAEDSERLAVIAERAATDPAFAALAELTIGKQGVTT